MKQIFLALILFSQSLSAQESQRVHIVKKGEVLSRVARYYLGHPIYKKDGSLEKLLALNSQVQNADQIYPGQLIVYSVLVTENAEPTAPTQTEVSAPEPIVLQNSNDVRGWLAFGLGAGYLDFKQSMQSAPEVAYASINYPSLSIRGAVQKNHWGAEAAYVRLPGKIKSSNTSVANSNFVWQSIAVEAFYSQTLQSNREKGFNGHLRMGIQHHDLPYAHVNNAGLALENSNFTMASIGGDIWYDTEGPFRFQLVARYQHPLMVKDQNNHDFESTPRFAFDGSLGALYDISSRLNAGAFWYGQWHEFNYSLTQGNGSKDSGNQKLFFSNFEFRLGYEF